MKETGDYTLQNSLEDLISYLEEKMGDGVDDDEADELEVELYEAYQKIGKNILKNSMYRRILFKIDEEVTDIYG